MDEADRRAQASEARAHLRDIVQELPPGAVVPRVLRLIVEIEQRSGIRTDYHTIQCARRVLAGIGWLSPGPSGRHVKSPPGATVPAPWVGLAREHEAAVCSGRRKAGERLPLHAPSAGATVSLRIYLRDRGHVRWSRKRGYVVANAGAGRVADMVRHQIAGGALAPDAPFERPMELAERYGVTGYAAYGATLVLRQSGWIRVVGDEYRICTEHALAALQPTWSDDLAFYPRLLRPTLERIRAWVDGMLALLGDDASAGVDVLTRHRLGLAHARLALAAARLDALGVPRSSSVEPVAANRTQRIRRLAALDGDRPFAADLDALVDEQPEAIGRELLALRSCLGTASDLVPIQTHKRAAPRTAPPRQEGTDR